MTATRRVRKGDTYWKGVSWIAQNDNPGDPDATDPAVVAGYVSTVMLADILGFDQSVVAKDVVEYRVDFLKDKTDGP